MKKLLTLAAVLALAGTASALSVNWNLTNIKQSDDSTKNASGYLVMLFVTAQNTENTAANATLTSVSEIEGFITSGKTIESKYIAASKTTTNGAVMGATGYGGNGWVKDETLSAFAVVFDASTQAAASNYYIVGGQNATIPGSGAATLGFGSQADASKNFAPAGVPEPATGALALAGIALLFRRRKA